MECKWQITNQHCFRLRHSLFPTIMRAPTVHRRWLRLWFTIYLLLVTAPARDPTVYTVSAWVERERERELEHCRWILIPAASAEFSRVRTQARTHTVARLTADLLAAICPRVLCSGAKASSCRISEIALSVSSGFWKKSSETVEMFKSYWDYTSLMSCKRFEKIFTKAIAKCLCLYKYIIVQ